MFEDKTFESVLKSLLSKVPSSLDKREGSVIYDALAPAAAEIAQLYIDMDFTIKETFADTADREYLIKRAAERGIEPYPASFSVAKGVFNIDVPIGSRFSIDIYNYAVTEAVEGEAHAFKMTCETAGSGPNGFTGRLIPIEYIQGLTSAYLTEILIPGEDEEGTEELRERYFNSLDSQAFGGNIQDYKEKTKALQGVGGVKVYPVWNGGGTVKLIIINSEYGVPTDELIESVQTAIDPEQNQGQGLGIAPIGHVVTVEGAGETEVNIETTITYAEGWSFEDIKPAAEEVIDGYFKELCGEWEESGGIIVRISQIETRLLDLEGVIDIEGTKLNGEAKNLALSENSLPKRGTLSA